MTPTDLLLERIFFGLCAAVAIAGGVGTVAFANPIRGAMSLLFCIVAISGMYLQLHAPFLAAIQLIVYAGAVVVLFIFVIMLIGPDATAPKDSRGLVARVLGGLAVSAVAVEIMLVVSRKLFFRTPPLQAGLGTVEGFGSALFGEFLVPFEVSSLLLMVAVVGAVAVARGNQPDPRLAKGEPSAREGEPGVAASPSAASEDPPAKGARA